MTICLDHCKGSPTPCVELAPGVVTTLWIGFVLIMACKEIYHPHSADERSYPARFRILIAKPSTHLHDKCTAKVPSSIGVCMSTHHTEC